MSEWKPIETAPKDGRIVQLGSIHPGYNVVPGEWNATKGRWEWPLSGRAIRDLFATHWAPLLDPPSTVKGESDS